MARYELRAIGVWDNTLWQRIVRTDPEWGAYREWLHQGNTPDPAPLPVIPPPTQAELDAQAELAARATMRDALKADATLLYLRTHTPAECAAWVNSNVTDLASAKNVLSKLAMICAYLARERLAGE